MAPTVPLNWRRLLLMPVGLLLAHTGQALQVEQLQAQFQHGEYQLTMTALLGRSMMLHSMRDATVTLFEHIEQRAAQLPPANAATGTGQ